MRRPRPVRTLRGVAAAPGLSAGPAVVWRDTAVVIPRATSRSPAQESQRLAAARGAAHEQISQLKTSVSTTASPEEAAIFDAHLMFLDDAALLEKAQAAIDAGTTAEAAWMDGIEFFAAQLAHLPDPTLQARAADVRDVGRRVLDQLLGRPAASLDLRAPSVVVARDLAPSQIASLPVARVLAFCTAEGGPTSHTAILAKAWGKPESHWTAAASKSPPTLGASKTQPMRWNMAPKVWGCCAPSSYISIGKVPQQKKTTWPLTRQFCR